MALTAVELVRGSDHSLTVTWKDANEEPIDFTGRILSFFDVSPSLDGRLSGLISAPATDGILTIRIDGTDLLPLGLHSFRFMLSLAGGDSLSSKTIYLRVV